MKVYPLPADKGLVVIDDSNGCFPLILWKSTRQNAFRRSLNDVVYSLMNTRLKTILCQPKSQIQWSDSLQREISQLFNYKTYYKKAA